MVEMCVHNRAYARLSLAEVASTCTCTCNDCFNLILFLLCTSQQENLKVNVGSAADHEQWVVKVDLNKPVHNFHEKIPRMAITVSVWCEYSHDITVRVQKCTAPITCDVLFLMDCEISSTCKP